MTDDNDSRIWRGLRAHLDELGRMAPAPDLAGVGERAERRNRGLGRSLLPVAATAVAVVLAVVVVGQVGLLAGVSPSASSTPPAWSAPSASSSTLAEGPDVMPVSLRAPSSLAAEGIALCGVQKWAKEVGGIGIIDHARLLPYYVPLTGREPEIQRDSRAFVVQFSGTIRLVTRTGPGSAAYADITGATCVVLDGAPIWYMTGPSTYSNGLTGTPEPAPLDTKDLPKPLP